MKRLVLSMFLIVCVFYASTPAQYESETYQSTEQMYSSLEASFEAELTAYAATHTEAELIAYAQARLDQLTTNGLDDPLSSSSLIVGDFSGFSSYYPDPFFYGDPDLFGGSDFQFCVNTRNEECRRLYNAELLTSAAVSTTIFAGCVGLTAGFALIACTAAALAVHALNVAAAKERYQGCLTRAYSDCLLSYRGR